MDQLTTALAFLSGPSLIGAIWFAGTFVQMRRMRHDIDLASGPAEALWEKTGLSPDERKNCTLIVSCADPKGATQRWRLFQDGREVGFFNMLGQGGATFQAEFFHGTFGAVEHSDGWRIDFKDGTSALLREHPNVPYQKIEFQQHLYEISALSKQDFILRDGSTIGAFFREPFNVCGLAINTDVPDSIKALLCQRLQVTYRVSLLGNS